MSIVTFLSSLLLCTILNPLSPFFIIIVGVPIEIVALYRNVNYAGDTYTGDYLSLGRLA